jgi:hypothetical protein
MLVDAAADYSAQLTNDGRMFQVASKTQDGDRLDLYVVETGRRRRLWSISLTDSPLLELSPSNRLLALKALQQGELAIVESATGALVRKLRVANQWLTCKAFSPDGKFLAAGTRQGFIVWDVLSGQVVTTLKGHRNWVTSLAFSPDGKRLVSGSHDTTLLVWDAEQWSAKAGGPKVVLAPKELETLWQELASDDPARGYGAVEKLVRSPKETVVFLQGKLHKVTAKEVNAVRACIADLSSNKYAVRDKAMAELEKASELAAPLLDKLLASKPSLEARRRVEMLLQKLETRPSPRCLQALRALEALEMIRTTPARQLLEALSQGDPDGWLTQEASASWERLQRN